MRMLTKAQIRRHRQTRVNIKREHPRKGARRNPIFGHLSEDALIDLVFTNALANAISSMIPADFKRKIVLQSANAGTLNPRDSDERSANI
jgi:hypothetical protein